MSDLVTRLRGWRDWREVHIVRTHMLLEEAADEIERLSQNSDCPDLDNAASPDILAADERAAVEDMASYFDARGNLTMQAWGSLLHVILRRMA